MVQNKTQIASDTHRYKKIVKKIFPWNSNHTYKLIYQKMSYETFLIKKWSYNENWASNTQKQVWRVFLSLLNHCCSVYISVSSSNQSFYKYDFLKNQWSPCCLNFPSRLNETKKLPVALCRWLFENIPNIC